MSRLSLNCSLVLVASLFLGGCSGTSDQPELVEVTGAITVDGNFVQGLRVVFQPTSGRRSVGITDKLGEYRLEYLDGVPGAVAGKHRVEITFTGEDVDQDEDAEPTDGGLDAITTIVIPANYNINSTLETNVASGNEKINFELTTNS